MMAIISHIGRNTDHGHYVCHVKKDNQWAFFNDEKVTVIFSWGPFPFLLFLLSYFIYLFVMGRKNRYLHYNKFFLSIPLPALPSTSNCTSSSVEVIAHPIILFLLLKPLCCFLLFTSFLFLCTCMYSTYTCVLCLTLFSNNHRTCPYTSCHRNIKFSLISNLFI